MRGTRGRILGGGDLGDALAAILGDSNGGQKHTIVPASPGRVRHLIAGIMQEKFKVGDYVQLRTEAMDKYEFPKANDRCIVTQVLDHPIHDTSKGIHSIYSGDRVDFAIAMMCQEHGNIMETLFDSREFVKVGSIYEHVDGLAAEQAKPAAE